MARSRIRKYAFHRAGVAARAVGSLSAGRRREPDFLVVGAQRAGTTSLFKALLQHPSFVPPRFRKGVHYFDMAYDKGWRWYLGHFPNRATVDKVAAATGGVALTGEASPYYMWHPLVPERIAADLPNVKLIVLLRDPVERAYSGHAHEYARGFETEKFDVAIDLEAGRLAGEADRMIADPTYHSHAIRHLAHLHRGIYIDQLERLEKLFGRDRILVVDSHDYFADPAGVFTGVCEFLGIPDAPDIKHDAHNARPRSAMAPAMEARLRDYFAPHDARLADWLGNTPSWRR
jgi:Sulfotransferase domain